MGGRRYQLRRDEIFDDWFRSATPDQCAAMRRWLQAMVTGPHELCTGSVRHISRRTLYCAIVPGTNALVTYFIFDVPVGMVTFSSVKSLDDVDL